MFKTNTVDIRSIITSCKIHKINKENNIILSTTKGLFYTKNILVCGGLFSDRIAKKSGLNPNLKIVGFRGDYYELKEEAKEKVKEYIIRGLQTIEREETGEKLGEREEQVPVSTLI